MRKSLFYLVSVLFFISAIPALKAQIDIGIAERTGEGISLAVESSDPAIRTLALRAFRLHGGVTLTTPANAAATVRIERAGGGNAALLTLGSGSSGQEQRRTVPGRDFNNAVLRACDLVIEATLDTKGFLAGKLAFVGKRGGVSEIYSSDLLFSQVRPLTNNRALVTGPRWSPDGGRLLFTTYHKSGFPDIYSIHLGTGRLEPVATYKGTNNGGSYSPDGRRIAMTLSGTGNSEIYIADSQGKNTRRLTTNKSSEASPNWSPDGRRLIYTSDAAGSPQLFQISVNGGAPQRIQTQISRYCSEPVWNPLDPNRIAFTASIGGGFQIAVYDFRTRQSKPITSGASSVEPYWLRDGRHLVFTRREGARTRLMIVDSETGKVAALHESGAVDASSPSFVY